MTKMTVDGNFAAAYVSYAFSEIAVIYPITPSTPMAELADEWQTQGKENLFGYVPKVVQMQSESGVAGALHGALSCGALSTTYTCSQGLLLMLPDMYKIAGEILPTVFYVSARALATHALSIFGDHQDVMACRQTGFCMLFSSSVQECMDMAVIAHIAALKISLPFLHIFDGFRTSHEINKIDCWDYTDMRSLIDSENLAHNIAVFRSRALNPSAPIQRGTAQNPDTYFQNREAANPLYFNAVKELQRIMDETAKITKRAYHVFDYYGDTDAKHVVVMMGSGAVTMQETIKNLNEQGKKYGLIIVRLYRPFGVDEFCACIPKTCEKICVLERTKEAGALGEPLYLDACGSLAEKNFTHIRVFGGRYGLGLKEFTPTMCLAVLKNLSAEDTKNHFTVGICDDIGHTSLDINENFHLSQKDSIACKFYGLGSDGTVGANKNSIKIIGDKTPLYAQGYFVYDSKKSGGITISHLRFGKTPIAAPYLIEKADFIACHDPSYPYRYDMLCDLKENGTFLLNCPYTDINQLNAYLPPSFKKNLVEKHAKFYVIDATKIANEVGLKGRTSTIMQAVFFLLNPDILPYETAVQYLKEEIDKKFSKKGEKVLQMNHSAVDSAKNAVVRIDYPDEWAQSIIPEPPNKNHENDYARNFIHPIATLHGDDLPVSAFAKDGAVPTGTTKYEKHGVANFLPQWISENCIQCNQCAFVCPHATIRPFVLPNDVIAPESFITKQAIGIPNAKFRVQIVPKQCKGCGVCAQTCPAKEKALVMRPAEEFWEKEEKNWQFALNAPTADTSNFKKNTVKGSQFQQPLFEFSYACAGCGETPYIKILTQLFGERMVIANATGCSSIYGGSSPTCPYTTNKNGEGPAWANSLFEDNAEFGLGMRLAWNIRAENQAKPENEPSDTHSEKPKSIWIIGGDGWAYDIGFGGLDHVLASHENVNILVLDSEVYSNTGGQASKATPKGATARFVSAGKRKNKKNLALMAMTYGHVYVAQVSLGANKQQLLNAFTEAEAHNGPSLIIAYSPCIAHGVDMRYSVEEEKRAVECGYWHLFRFNPALKKEGKASFVLDSKAVNGNYQEFLMGENRFASLKKAQPQIAEELFNQAEQHSQSLLNFYQTLSKILEE